ncbi:MAG: chloride channel protein [Chloroflexota bacterium]
MSSKSETSNTQKQTIFRKQPFSFPSLIDRIQPDSEIFLVTISLIIGIAAGLGAVAFRYMITGIEWLGYTWFPSWAGVIGKGYVILIPCLGGLIVGPLTYFFAREAKGHGVPEVMEAVALKGGRIRPIVALIKALASALTIGSGGSVGREGPIVQIGSAIGSTLGQILHLSENRIRNLVACGAAGGIAATFNSPIAGVIFALEIILGEFNVSSFSSLVISAVSASVIGRIVFDNMPAFKIPMEYGVASLWEFPLYLLLGVLAGLFGWIYVRTVYFSEDVFNRVKKIPEWVKPAVGGIILGGIALAYPLLTGVQWEHIPHVFNVGYNVIESALGNHLVLKAAFVLLMVKLLATSLTLGSGGSGGIFAPALFMGAMLGSAFELTLRPFFPSIIGPEGAFALVGMGALFAASAHAPITSVIILFELTGNYKIILPLMLTVVIATLISRKLLRGESIYTLKLSRRGVQLRRGKEVDIMESITVREVMTSNPITVKPELKVSALPDLFIQTNMHGFPVVDDEGKLWGIVTISDYRKAMKKNGMTAKERTIKDIATHALVTAYPDENVSVVLKRMAPRDLSRIPVVSRQDKRHLIGILRRNDIVRAYDIGTLRREQS